MDIKNLLKQYNDLILEIKGIVKLKNKKIKVERDKVSGSNPYFSYEPRTFNVERYNYPEADAKELNIEN